MEYQLLASRIPPREVSAVEQVLFNRGIDPENVEHYLNTTDEDILNFEAYSRSMDANSYIEMVIKDIEDNKNTSYASPQVLRYAKKVIEFRKRINK
mgnify:CR=1 FL=1